MKMLGDVCSYTQCKYRTTPVTSIVRSLTLSSHCLVEQVQLTFLHDSILFYSAKVLPYREVKPSSELWVNNMTCLDMVDEWC